MIAPAISCKLPASRVVLLSSWFSNGCHLLARGTSLQHLDAIPPERIFLVQLSEYNASQLSAPEDIIDAAGRRRVFPGEGVHGNVISELEAHVEHAGYRGYYTLEVFNEDYRQYLPSAIAARARKSVEWLTNALN